MFLNKSCKKSIGGGRDVVGCGCGITVSRELTAKADPFPYDCNKTRCCQSSGNMYLTESFPLHTGCLSDLNNLPRDRLW